MPGAGRHILLARTPVLRTATNRGWGMWQGGGLKEKTYEGEPYKVARGL